jgi:subtilisin family serine protease
MSDPGPTSVRSSIRKKLPSDGDWDAVPTAPSQFLEVEILTRPDDLAAAETAVESAGGAVSVSHGSRIVGDVPADSVTTVAQSDAVRLVGEVVPPQEHALPATEGLEITRAADLHDEGVTGQDVTIAVLDSAFDTSNPKYDDQVVATIGPDAYFEASGAHGDATAEITAGMAPDADLVLATVFGMDIFNVIDELENNYPEVEVATMSIGYYPIRLDGGDPYSQRIGAFTADDRLFTTSAGNASAVDNAWQWDDTNDQAVPIAQEYGTVWHGAWRDPDGDRLFEFDEPSLPNDERLPVSTSLSDGELGNMDSNEAVGWIAINWDADWVTDDQRYRVRLYDDANATYPVEESFTTTPFEEVIPEAQDFLAGDDYVHVEIEQFDATGDEYFDIWAWGNDLQFDLPWAKHDRCIGLPGTSQDEDTLAIAAVQAVELETTGIAFAKNKGDLKPYSSQGPTQDGRRGIDLAGPSHVSTVAYGDVETNFGFNGTSAACPHVGGGAGLLLGINGITTDEVRNSMLATGTGIPDSEVGAPSETNTKIGDGYLDVYAASQTADADYEIAVAGSIDVPDRTVLIDDRQGPPGRRSCGEREFDRPDEGVPGRVPRQGSEHGRRQLHDPGQRPDDLRHHGVGPRLLRARSYERRRGTRPLPGGAERLGRHCHVGTEPIGDWRLIDGHCGAEPGRQRRDDRQRRSRGDERRQRHRRDDRDDRGQHQHLRGDHHGPLGRRVPPGRGRQRDGDGQLRRRGCDRRGEQRRHGGGRPLQRRHGHHNHHRGQRTGGHRVQ